MLRSFTNTQDVLPIRRPKRQLRHDEVWELWHVWTITIPRRSITGRLLWGTVLRRRDDGRWIYKKYIENADISQASPFDL
jgi:hypothetical protein